MTGDDLLISHAYSHTGGGAYVRSLGIDACSDATLDTFRLGKGLAVAGPDVGDLVLDVLKDVAPMTVSCSFVRVGGEIVLDVAIACGCDDTLCATRDGHSHSIGVRYDGDAADPDPLTLAYTAVVNLSACEDVGKAVPACGLSVHRVEGADNGVNSYSSYVDIVCTVLDLLRALADCTAPYVGVVV